MAVPKRKTSKWRRDQRRSQNFFSKLSTLSLSTCPNCGELIMPHRACPYCGYYKGREVVNLS
ncbi:MAG: 50S ribosomal protein L32 [Aquificaceae bacterium]|nr:50S ribosomal protein L32 [Aquificaceae bacterium]MDW8095209.1 50S ribosomal protein L32 [Aquificaceae bacterium]